LQVFASLEASLVPRRPAWSPDWGTKYSDAPRTPGSKVNPLHANLLTQPGNQISALFEQPTAVQPSLALCGCCAGWPVSLCGTVLPTPILPGHHWTATPSKGVRHHPGRCCDARQAEHISSVTSDPVQPSSVLCRHPGHYDAITNTVRA
jgi:hypothetical protein